MLAVGKGAQREKELFREGEIERKAAECWEKLLKPSPRSAVSLHSIPTMRSGGVVGRRTFSTK